ncbi:two-component system sensor histidine kinase EvgS [Pseudomonas chlororaphis]|uniref:ATP-binding protein n=1 Tax=Pseudomonas chlororaphis TaxID=587753 RepID=UPI00209F6F40|nr:transporter substrate-binding domain-containing protein [Pseudomonas chlororaphis]MCP1482001.1 two-component system sensor histidine kinase EvgS [Pseudomonas chlororaphis]MCP1597640.1 two-component system sensor histidine kinase EvgS [Pseudomonas chlororaphis]
MPVRAEEGDLLPIAKQQLTSVKVQLSEQERVWLEHKKTLVVGVLSGLRPPYRIFTENGSFEGLAADYLVAMQRELGVSFKVRPYDSSAAVYEALRQGQVDLVAGATAQDSKDFGVQLTPPYAVTELALFAERGDLREYSIYDPHLRIAVGHNAALRLYESNGGRGIFTLYTSPLAAMASVLAGKNDVYLSDSLSTNYLASQRFTNQLDVSQSSRLPEVKVAFAVAANNTLLAGIFERGLGDINHCQLTSAQYLWGGREGCEEIDFRSRLTDSERTWLNSTHIVRLAISEDLPPYAFFNSRGRLNGIASDLLDIIRRKTDIRFEIIRASSLGEVDSLLVKGNADIGILVTGSTASLQYPHTRPFLSAAYLTVMRNGDQAHLDEHSAATVAVAKGYLLSTILARQYPHVRVKETDTTGEAFKLVREGRAEFALAPTNVARYYLSYKYETSLKAGIVLNIQNADVVFAAPRDNFQIISILDKVIAEIPPREFLQIIARWRADSATDEKYWEGIASDIWYSFQILGGLLLLAVLLIITQRRRIKRKRCDLHQRQLLLNELQAAKDSAEKANKSKSVFLATMSHEIRTPLNAIIGMLELVLTRKDKVELNAQSLHIAYESALGLLALIGDVLDISRIESKKLILVPEPARMKALLESTSNVFSGLARQKQLSLSLNIDPLGDEQVWVDSIKVKQIISNLLSNAIKFTERGGISIRCQVSPTSDNTLYFRISISDTGAGIPAAQIDQVFKAFFVTHEAISDPNAGAGLGLAICQALSKLMGGRLEVESEVGVGTRMIFSIELERVSAKSAVAIADSGTLTQQVNEAPLTVLIVEDHLPSQYLLYQQVTYLGHHVFTASNGSEGLAMWQENEIDIVLTDCNMPEMNGHEMTKSIRRLEKIRAIRPCVIIGLTADAQREVLEGCVASGMDHSLSKPITLASLNRWIPKRDANSRQLRSTLSPVNDIRTAMAEQIIESNHSESAVLQHALEKHDLAEIKCIAHKLKGTAYLLNHSGLLEQCVEVEELCSEGIMSVDTQNAVIALIKLLNEIGQSLRSN